MTTMKAAVDDLFGSQLSTEEAIDRHFHATFHQRVNGHLIDRTEFLLRMVDLRGVVRSATVDVLQELTDGSRYAEHHIIDLVRHDGGHIVQEVLVFAERAADGRFVHIAEMSQAVDGPAPDTQHGEPPTGQVAP